MSKYLIQIGDLAWTNVMIAAAVIGAVYYFAMFDDGTLLTEQIDAANVQLVEAERQFKQTQKAMQDAERFEAEVQALQRQFEDIIKFMPESMKDSELSRIVSDCARRAELNPLSLTPAKGENKGFYETSKLSFNLQGSFPQVMRFLSELSKVPNLLTLEGVQIEKVRAGTEANAVLSFKASIVGYKYLRSSLTENGAAQPGAGGTQR